MRFSTRLRGSIAASTLLLGTSGAWAVFSFSVTESYDGDFAGYGFSGTLDLATDYAAETQTVSISISDWFAPESVAVPGARLSGMLFESPTQSLLHPAISVSSDTDSYVGSYGTLQLAADLWPAQGSIVGLIDFAYGYQSEFDVDALGLYGLFGSINYGHDYLIEMVFEGVSTFDEDHFAAGDAVGFRLDSLVMAPESNKKEKWKKAAAKKGRDRVFADLEEGTDVVTMPIPEPSAIVALIALAFIGASVRGLRKR